ncbi:hypothetical protein BH09SUM1_BH09SUM1_19360 [soil metagenome]
MSTPMRAAMAALLCASLAGAAPNFPPTESNVPPAPKAPLANLIPKGNAIATAPRQVAGALSGRIVYCSGGHGWTYMNPPNMTYWAVQRPDAISGAADVVEDFGNVDQLAFFAKYCLNAGAIVVPFRPIGFQDHEVIIDNDDPQVTFTPPESWSVSDSPRFYGDAGDDPYRAASSVSGAATASAVFDASSLITVSGDYPVYVWARSGADRINQEFIVTFSGGQASRRINLRWTGGFWIYIGTYYFAAGGPASVTVTNSAEEGDPGSVVIADAVRFGNGMGSIDRGTGVSGHPRQEECSRYWVMAGIGQGADVTYGTTGNDQNDNVGTPPRTAAYMNATSADWADAGNREDRIFLSFHTNARGGVARGAVGLYCSNTDSVTTPNGACTTNQYPYAALMGRVINEDLYARTTAAGNPFELPWSTNGISDQPDDIHRFGSGSAAINSYGEMSFAATSNEFDATIAEVAFHDNTSDTKLLRDPKIRDAIARAALHGIVKYFNTYDSAPTAFLPTAPEDVYLVSDASGNETLHWTAGLSSPSDGDPATGYVIYVSTDGMGYGYAQSIDGAATLSADVTTLIPLGQARYFRVSATNAGGESFPSVSVGAMSSGVRANTLIVNGFDRYERTQDPMQTEFLSPTDQETFARIDPQRINTFNYVPVAGATLAAHETPFDSCQNENITSGAVALSDYANVIWILGEENAASETFSTAEQTLVTAFLAGGGNLFVSGSEIAQDLDNTGTPSDSLFMHSQLHSAYFSSSAATHAAEGSTGGIFDGQSLSFDNGASGNYDVDSPDQLSFSGAGASIAMTYSGGNGGNAAVAYNGSGISPGRVVTLAFPVEAITSAPARNAVMTSVLDFFGEAPASPLGMWMLY